MRAKLLKSKPLKQIIGWREIIALPKLSIERIKAKIDTGARTSALHAEDIQVYRTKKGKKMVRFVVHPLQRDKQLSINCRAPLVDKRYVRSSSGKGEQRFTITTKMSLGGRHIPIELTLTNRDQMGFRLLLGRTAVCEIFMVDPAKSFLHGK